MAAAGIVCLFGAYLVHLSMTFKFTYMQGVKSGSIEEVSTTAVYSKEQICELARNYG